MDETEFTRKLLEQFEHFRDCALQNDADAVADDMFEGEVERVKTFRCDGLMSIDAGLVVRMRDGSEFQVTIVQSRGPR